MSNILTYDLALKKFIIKLIQGFQFVIVSFFTFLAGYKSFQRNELSRHNCRLGNTIVYSMYTVKQIYGIDMCCIYVLIEMFCFEIKNVVCVHVFIIN